MPSSSFSRLANSLVLVEFQIESAIACAGQVPGSRQDLFFATAS